MKNVDKYVVLEIRVSEDEWVRENVITITDSKDKAIAEVKELVDDYKDGMLEREMEHIQEDDELEFHYCDDYGNEYKVIATRPSK